MTTTLVWIDALGADQQLIQAHVLGERVLVDDDTLGTMESSVLAAGILSDADAAELAREIRSTPRELESGWFDVTEVGGGWSVWRDQVVEP